MAMPPRGHAHISGERDGKKDLETVRSEKPPRLAQKAPPAAKPKPKIKHGLY